MRRLKKEPHEAPEVGLKEMVGSLGRVVAGSDKRLADYSRAISKGYESRPVHSAG